MKQHIALKLISIVLLCSCQKEPAEFINTYLAPPVVDAGASHNVQLPGTDTLRGSATSTNGRITGYLWSLVSGPNVPLIQSPGSKVTAISGLSTGSYLFQLMAVDSAGLTGVDTVRVNAIPSPQVTLNSQPQNNPYEFKFAVVGSTNVSAQGLDFVAQAWTSGGTPFYVRSAVKFDLSSIPSNATIVSAKLSLYSNPTPTNGNQMTANSGSSNALLIRRITSSWTANVDTWASQPGTDPATQVVVPHTDQPFLDLIDVDVKSIVQAQVSGGNYGFMLQLQNETIYNARQFCTSWNTNTAKHPKLVVVYQ